MKTLASDLIGGLVPEGSERKKSFGRSKGVLEQIINTFDYYCELIDKRNLAYGLGIPLVREKIPAASSQEIQFFYDFVTKLSKKETSTKELLLRTREGALSYFLNELLNCTYEKSVHLTLHQRLDGLARGFGTYTAQQLTIHGNVGWTVAEKMTKGTIRIYGESSECTGEGMTGGKLIISGSVSQVSSFTGGIIQCNDFCLRSSTNVGTLYAKRIGDLILPQSEKPQHPNGTIHVKEGIHQIDPRCNATIYLAGKKYWENGKKI